MPRLNDFLERFDAVRRETRKLARPEARQAMERLFYVPLAEREKVAKVLDERIAGPGGLLPLRIYIPEGKAPHPILLFFHWGGWVYGSIEEADPLCRKLCRRSGAAVVSVDYRLAPEHPFPAALEDCWAAAVWASRHGHEFLGDPLRLAVAGESAGGNLAAALALRAGREKAFKLALQVLIYPILSYEVDDERYRRYADQTFITAEGMRWFWKQYLPQGKVGKEPLVAPLEAQDFDGVPPAIIVTAGGDPLREEGLAYAKLLRAHKKTAVVLDYPEAIHGFLDLPAGLADSGRALEQLCRDIQIFLAAVDRQHA